MRTHNTETVIARLTARRALRFALVWAAVFGGYILLEAVTYHSTYPTIAARRKFAASFENNAGIAALVGPARRLDTVAGYLDWRLSIVTLTGAIAGLLLATRLTRGEEESGRWELLLAGHTTRRRATGQAIAGLAAGLLVLWLVTTGATMVAARQRTVSVSLGSALFYATTAVCGTAMFVAVGVLAGQVAATRRQANGIAAAVLGVAFLIRMIADAGSGLGWLRWASPLGWLEEVRPLGGSRPLALIPVIALVVLSTGAAFLLAGRRDLGAGSLPARDNPRPSAFLLGGPARLAVRLGLPVAAAWVVGLAVLGFTMGLVAPAAASAISGSRTLEQALARLGGQHGGALAYLGFAFLTAAVLVILAAAGQIAAMRNDEARGYLDNLLARPVGRRTWITGRLGFAAALVVAASLAAGCAAWVGAATQHGPVGIGSMLRAAANIAAPGLFVLGVGALLYALVPRVATVLIYAVVAWSYVVEIVGATTRINHWLLDTALLSHIRPVPAADISWTSVGWLAGLGLVTAAIGVLAFRHRDLAGE